MSRRGTLRLRLFVADDAPNSTQARANLAAQCRDYLPGQCEIEIIDVFKHPERALADSVFMTPTLIRVAPAPQRRVVGNLGQARPVLDALGVPMPEPPDAGS